MLKMRMIISDSVQSPFMHKIIWYGGVFVLKAIIKSADGSRYDTEIVG